MKSLLYILSFVLLAPFVWSCGGTTTPADKVDDACQLFELGNYDGAIQAVDKIMADSLIFNELDVHDLCSLAQLCLRLDSVKHLEPEAVAEESDAIAARCLSRAGTLNADSVEMFIRNLPREQAMRLSVINRVSTYLTIPRDSLVVENDSL